MIEPTARAKSLPEDLKKYWDDAMADKFPMTREEAMAYIQGHYRNVGVGYCEPDGIYVSYTHTIPIQEGMAIPNGYSASKYLQYNGSPNSLYNQLTGNYRPIEASRHDQIIITDFRLTAIKEKLAEVNHV